MVPESQPTPPHRIPPPRTSLKYFSTGTTAPTASTGHILAVMTSPRAILSFLLNPLHLLIWAAVLVGLHFLIWKAERVREFWHRRLVWVGLK